jgi:hypothetical protein
MNTVSIVDDLTDALHSHPGVVKTVGGRVTRDCQAGGLGLPNIIIDAVSRADAVTFTAGGKVRITCRAKTPTEADHVGDAVVTALTGARVGIENMKLVKVTDRSGYDHASGAFRRVIFVDVRR